MSLLDDNFIETDFIRLGSVFEIDSAKFALWPFQIKSGKADFGVTGLFGRFKNVMEYHGVHAEDVQREIAGLPLEVNDSGELRPNREDVLEFVRKHIGREYPGLDLSSARCDHCCSSTHLYTTVSLPGVAEYEGYWVKSLFTLKMKLPEQIY